MARQYNFLHTLVAAASAVGINAIPVAAVLAWGRSLQTGMVLYFLETLVGTVLTVVFVLLRAPAEDPGYASIASGTTTSTVNGHTTYHHQSGSRRSLLEGYLIFSVGFAVVPSVFFLFWMFVVAHAGIDAAAITSGLAGMAAFQALNFIAELVACRVLTPAGANAVINQSMGRVALIYVSVFAGMAVALLFAAAWFIVPFSILKTLADWSFLFRKRAALNAPLPDGAASSG